MSRLFYCTFNRNMRLFYDGCFIEYDNGKIVGYTHDGILTGTVTSEIIETNEECYINFPVEEGYIADGHQLVYDYDNEQIIIKFYESSYDYEIEEKILERTLEKADKLPEEVQSALKKFLEEGETDT